jgi:hypothetical protein
MTPRASMSFKNYAGLLLTLCAALGTAPALAALGEAEATASNDAQRAGGSIHSIQRATYRVHEIQLPSGTVLREFVGADGTVFGVAWQGPAQPNLRQALGRYFDTYISAQAGKHARGHVEVRQDGFVAQSHGHMRSFSGRAFLSDAVPSTMALQELH